MSDHPIKHIKIRPEYFDAVKEGRKTFEIRKNDRNYQCGNTLILHEWEDGEYTGRVFGVTVSYILTYEDFPDGIRPGYCILGIRRSDI